MSLFQLLFTLVQVYTFDEHCVSRQVNTYVYNFFVQEVGHLSAFRSPGHAIAKTLLQLVGEFGFEDIFNQGALLYNPTAYILFIAFLITMPLLFTNLLVSCYSL